MVLFPGGPLPLRIFEPRYLGLVSRCLKRDQPFVVTLALSGTDQGHTRCAAVGTTARIIDFDRAADGLLTLRTVGERRVRLGPARREPDGLALATVTVLDEPPPMQLTTDDAVLVAVLRELLPADDPLYRGVPRRWDDALWVSYRAAEQLPIEAQQRQQLLELDDLVGRLAVLRCVAAALSDGR